MDLDHAILAHQQFKSRLNQFIGGSITDKLDSAVIGRDDQCELGRWIHGEGYRLHNKEEAFKQLEAAHAHFHQKAGVVAKLYMDGEAKKAQEMYDEVFLDESKEIALAVRRLKHPALAK